MEHLKPQISTQQQDIIIVPLPNNSTILQDRILWFDGDSSVNKSKILSSEYKGSDISRIYILDTDLDIEKYNQYVEEKDQIKVKTKLNQIVNNWKIPQEYIDLDVKKYVYKKADEYIDSNVNIRSGPIYNRVELEFKLYQQYDLFMLLKTLIYIINTLEKNSCVFAGRGSSVSSFILYLIGAHDVDSLMYDIDITDFLHD